jgi:hypothetical protein
MPSAKSRRDVFHRSKRPRTKHFSAFISTAERLAFLAKYRPDYLETVRMGQGRRGSLRALRALRER